MLTRTFLFLLIAAFSGRALAQVPTAALNPPLKITEGDYQIHDFHFTDGESLPELKVHYRTIGTPIVVSGEIQNAVLLLHATTSTGAEFLTDGFRSAMFGPGQPLDASKYYTIAPDAIGLGGSSKPSDGLHARFPHYGYSDMVEAQKELVTRGLGVNHLKLVLGTSMGGMHTWLWAEKYPGLMDGIIPIVCQAEKVSGRNLLWRRLITTAIRTDPSWKNGEYRTQPWSLEHTYPLLLMMLGNAREFQIKTDTLEETQAFLESAVAFIGSGKLDTNDVLYRLEASADYDPAPDLGRVSAAVLSINFADDEINPPELGFIERGRRAVPNGKFILVPASQETIGHQTFAKAAVYQEYVAEFLRRLAKQSH